MADYTHVREIGRVTDMDGVELVVGVDYDAVTIGYEHLEKFRLLSTAAEEFGQLFISACWQAARQQGGAA